ncbi:Do family serine endopeptidase [Roseiconus lacunae]|uniref:Do family serine endopeptidase n=1 Tax=Roseiconus lacunae TaxID=2605694 RepID=UPI001E3958A4|nr:Do family serine endopeptidase [Roseiconus lacunae]MCD0461590.1 Do family serine endopeptidase [Roseiconus lacunae]
MRSTAKKRSMLLGLILTSAIGFGSGAAYMTADASSKTAPAKMMDNLPAETLDAIHSANNLSMAFRAVSEHVMPSLVAIENRPAVAVAKGNKMIRPSADPFSGQNPFKGTPFEDMLRDFEGMRRFEVRPDGKMIPKGFGDRMPHRARGIGSGVVIDASGIILTNNHVVTGGGEVTVKLNDGREFVASQVWTDPDTDIAVVKIEGASGLVPAALGNSDDTEIGDWVIAMGQPFGLESSVTAGIISAKHRGIGITARENFLQTDAAINPGNSGGPLVNLKGEVIGINTAISSRGGGNDGIGFAVPSNLAHWVSDQLREHGTVKRAYLGVGIQPITQALAGELGVQPRGGVLITDVYDQTPAAEMGLESGDVIVRFGDKEVRTPQALQLAVERSPVGEKIAVAVVRDGKEISLTYRGTEAKKGFFDRGKKAEKPSAVEPDATEIEGFGLEVAALDSAIAKSLEIDADRGVVITGVEEGSPSAEAGLKPGMVITEVDRTEVNDVKSFEAAMKETEDDTALLLVKSERGSRFVVVKRN